MSQKLIIIVWCALIVLATMSPTIGGEAGSTLPADTPSDTAAALPEAAAAAKRDTSHLSNDTTNDSAAGAAETRDSTVHAMLAALERDASVKALAEEESGLPEKAGRSGPGGIVETVELLRLKAMRHQWVLAVAAGVAVLLIVALIIAAKGRANRESRRFMTTTRLSLMNSEVQRACLYIEKNYFNSGLSPSVVCDVMVTGVPFLETLFEKELGMSIGDYINQARIHRAKLLANRTPGINSGEIAPQVGFSDAAAFETQFKLVAGTEYAVFCREKAAS